LHRLPGGRTVARQGMATMSGSNRVNRGGSWNNDARNYRSANHNNWHPGNRNDNLGLRLLSTRLSQRAGFTDPVRALGAVSRWSSGAGSGRPNSTGPRRVVGSARGRRPSRPAHRYSCQGTVLCPAGQSSQGSEKRLRLETTRHACTGRPGVVETNGVWSEKRPWRCMNWSLK
jgi:hypothetical protein